MHHVGTIIRKQLASPTVMVLELKVPTLSSFLPGQWVDFMVPPHSWIGGFSIASSPKDLPNLTLAIKRSSHPPAAWVHESSHVNQDVHVQVGGTCVLPPLDSSTTTTEEFAASPPRIFCAGGIGISPVLSQYREFLSQRSAHWTPTSPGPAARFLYTVSLPSELVFADELAELARKGKAQNPHDQMIFSLTLASKWEEGAVKLYPGVELKIGRVMKIFLDNCSYKEDCIYYLCGPPAMLDDATTHLADRRGVDPKLIQYEIWW